MAAPYTGLTGLLAVYCSNYCSKITSIHSGSIVAILDFVCKLVYCNIAGTIHSGNIAAILPKPSTYDLELKFLAKLPEFWQNYQNSGNITRILAKLSEFWQYCHKKSISHHNELSLVSKHSKCIPVYDWNRCYLKTFSLFASLPFKIIRGSDTRSILWTCSSFWPISVARMVILPDVRLLWQ